MDAHVDVHVDAHVAVTRMHHVTSHVSRGRKLVSMVHTESSPIPYKSWHFTQTSLKAFSFTDVRQLVSFLIDTY